MKLPVLDLYSERSSEEGRIMTIHHLNSECSLDVLAAGLSRSPAGVIHRNTSDQSFAGVEALLVRVVDDMGQAFLGTLLVSNSSVAQSSL